MKSFKDYKLQAHEWITLMPTEYYPDYLPEAVELYAPAQERFRMLVEQASTSEELLRLIMDEPVKQRAKLLSLFCRYVSPLTKTELLKKKGQLETTLRYFGPQFRPLEEVRSRLFNRPMPDETMAALLYQYKDRGALGYELTDRFFKWFEQSFPSPPWEIKGPRREGPDLLLSEVISEFPENFPVDFVILHDNIVRAVGFARYDTDRGGSQEDDRTGGNRDKVVEIREFSHKQNYPIKVIFLNDGPGLLLGSMWDDYSALEDLWPGNVIVVTLKMLDERLTEQWLLHS